MLPIIYLLGAFMADLLKSQPARSSMIALHGFCTQNSCFADALQPQLRPIGLMH
jgi:hypothetical protein